MVDVNKANLLLVLLKKKKKEKEADAKDACDTLSDKISHAALS